MSIRSEPHALVAPEQAGSSGRVRRDVALALLLAAACAGVRLIMLWRQGGLFSDIEYDDGVHLGSSILLAHGHVLYRDQTFLHPPGISLLLLPFAWISSWCGQPMAFAIARLATVAASAAVAGLLAYVVGRASTSRRALLAGGFAVVLAPSIVAGSTLMLEPWLGLFGMLAVERLTRTLPSRADIVAAGVYLAAETTVKAWGVIALLGVGSWLICERRTRDLRRMAIASAVTFVLLVGPFVVQSGGRFLADVVWTQLSRPPDGVQGTLARTANLLQIHGPHSAATRLLVTAVLAGLCLLILRGVRAPGLARLGALVVAIAVPVFANAPSFFFHYGDFFTPWAALLVAGQPPLRPLPRLVPHAERVAAAVLVLGLVHQSFGVMRRQKGATVNLPQLQRLAGHQDCVVSDQASLLLLAGAFDRPNCPSWLDPRGAALTELPDSAGADFYPRGFQRIPRWQREYVGLISRADVLVLTNEPCRHPEWTADTCQWVQRHFRQVATVGRAGPGQVPIQVWRRGR